MSTKLAERFAQVVEELESNRDVEKMAELYADDAQLLRIAQSHDYRGRAGARAFWREYLDLFQEVRTEFRTTVDEGGCAVLEWTSRGKLRNGTSFSYDGVSIVEADPDGRVIAFRTYYDPTKLLGARPDGATMHGNGARAR